MKNIFLLVFSPAFVWVLYDLVFNLRPMYSNGETGLLFFLVLIFDLVALVYVFAFSVFIKLRPFPCSYGVRRLPFLIYPFVFLSVVFWYFFLLHSVFGSVSPINALNNYDHFYTKNSEGTAWVFLIFNALIFLLLYDVYRAGATSGRIFFIVSSLLIISLTGGRSTIIVQFFFLLYTVYVVHGKKMNLMVVLGVFLISSFVFVGNAIMRSGGVETYANSSAQLDFDSSFILFDVASYVETDGPEYFVSLDDFYNFFIPRVLNPDKPISTAETRLIYPEVAARGTNYTFGYYGNMLLNLGYAGLFLFPFILLMYQYLYYSYSLRYRANAAGFVIIFFCFYSIQFVRGGFINSRFLIFLFSIVAACLAWSMLTRFVFFSRRV